MGRMGWAAIAYLGCQLHKFGRSLIQISQKALPFFGYESVTAFRQAPSSQDMVYEAFLYYLPKSGKNSLPKSSYEFVTEKRQSFLRNLYVACRKTVTDS